ncbi:MAG: ribosomal L7Ae/L30e/S12e/Gadd45 family protein [Eubacteriales bacterium]|nr:ribosomal L7Ae/L30e/S12e/Gadd45 family protein [Eubacteriales bacterium]
MEDNVEKYPSRNKLTGMLGLAHKAGKLIFGTERIIECIKIKKAYIVLLASDISANTRKRIENCCKYYKVKYYNISMTMDMLSHFIGQMSAVSAVAIKDKSFTAAILNILNSTTVVKRDYPREV